jgi:hypothetical protein
MGHYLPVNDPSDDRSPLSAGLQWTSRITGVALEMVMPGLAGHWLDQKLGTVAVFLLLGVVLGFILGLRTLIQFGKQK